MLKLLRIYEAAKSKRSSGRASGSSQTTSKTQNQISEVYEKNFDEDRKILSELLNMKAGDLVDAQEFEEL